MGDIIDSYGVKRLGVQDRKRVERVHLVKSRRQREMEKLVKERRNLRKQWKKDTEEERKGINVLQEELRSRLAILRRADEMDVRPPRWKEVEEVVRRAKASSAYSLGETVYS